MPARWGLPPTSAGLWLPGSSPPELQLKELLPLHRLGVRASFVAARSERPQVSSRLWMDGLVQLVDALSQQVALDRRSQERQRRLSELQPERPMVQLV